jgi:hypothetical protein
MHDFDALLVSDCERLAREIGRADLAERFRAIRDPFASPEEIYDSPQTHPARRIIELVPEYRKPLHGNIAAIDIGLDRIRSACPHFQGWLERSERLAPEMGE